MRLPLVRRSRYDAMVEAAAAAMGHGFRDYESVNRVADLHREVLTGVLAGTCAECYGDYPCDTIRAIQGDAK